MSNCLYKIEFSCDCDLYPYSFEDGWVGIIYLSAYIAETEEDVFEEGEEDGEGVFHADMKRSRRVYVMRTDLVTQQTLEMLYLLPLMDTVELTLLTGEVVEMNNIEISHEYQFDDRQEATVEIRYDINEYITSKACCNF